jgi:hypothetical protein
MDQFMMTRDVAIQGQRDFLTKHTRQEFPKGPPSAVKPEYLNGSLSVILPHFKFHGILFTTGSDGNWQTVDTPSS